MTDEKPRSLVPAIPMGERGVKLTSLEDAFRLATAVHKSGLAPASLKSPEQVLVALATGMEAGLTPMAALRSIYVVNGKPAWYGDAALALVRARSRAYAVVHGWAGDGDEHHALVTTVRDGVATETRFSVADARRAGLWGKAGPWSQYPERMLYYRALGFALRDQFSDVLCGLAIAEEVQDYPAVAAPDTLAAPEAVAAIALAEPDPLLADWNEEMPQERTELSAKTMDADVVHGPDREPAHVDYGERAQLVAAIQVYRAGPLKTWKEAVWSHLVQTELGTTDLSAADVSALADLKARLQKLVKS